MDKTVTRTGRISDQKNDDFVPGTPESRVSLVWQLTLEAVSLSKHHDAEQRLRRDVTVLSRRKG